MGASPNMDVAAAPSHAIQDRMPDLMNSCRSTIFGRRSRRSALPVRVVSTDRAARMASPWVVGPASRGSTFWVRRTDAGTGTVSEEARIAVARCPGRAGPVLVGTGPGPHSAVSVRHHPPAIRGAAPTMTATTIAHPTVSDRRAAGARARVQVPPSSHAGWRPAAGRPDPVALLEAQNVTREQDLVPVRHGRMVVSPFTFYRGAAKIMAADLAGTPTAGLDVQLCGDGHLSNFGAFASPERRLLFDLNDFDETLPGPFEYDVKRMAASFTIAARNNGFSPSDTSAVTLKSVSSYRETMIAFAKMNTLDIWYAHRDEQDLMKAIDDVARASKTKADRRLAKGAGRQVEKA